MKKYIKNNNTLVSGADKIKVYSTIPQNPPQDELYFVENSGLYYGDEVIFSHIGGGSSIPTGEIRMFYGVQAPVGWRICDGSTFDTTRYSELYSLLGDNHLPDMRECTILGKNTTVGNFIDDGMSHTHSWIASQHTHSKDTSSATHKHTYTKRNSGTKTCSYEQFGTTNKPPMSVNASQNRAWTDYTALPTTSEENSNITIEEVTSSIDNVGTTTRNVSVGINYIIYMGA